MVVFNLALRVRGSDIGRNPGKHEIIVVVADKEVASFAFEILAEKGLLRKVRISSLALIARSRNGEQIRALRSLNRSLHDAVYVELEFEIPILAPNVLISSSVVLDQSGVILNQANFDLRLDRTRRGYRTASLRLSNGMSSGITDIEIRITFSLSFLYSLPFDIHFSSIWFYDPTLRFRVFLRHSPLDRPTGRLSSTSQPALQCQKYSLFPP